MDEPGDNEERGEERGDSHGEDVGGQDEPGVGSNPTADPSHDPSDDPDLDALLEHADRAELETFIPLATAFLEADGDDVRDDYPPGEILVQGVLAAAAAGYVVGGEGDPVFGAAMSFILSDRARFAVRAWRLVAAMGEEEIGRMLAAARGRAAEQREKEDEQERRDG